MRKQRFFKQLGACLLAGILLLGSAVPAGAATSYKKGQSKLVTAGQSYHLMNNNISQNKITNYTVAVIPQEPGTRFDMAVALNGKEELMRNGTKAVGATNRSATYVKSSASSNYGMLACIRVHKGSVLLKVQYQTKNKSAALYYKKQASSHQTLKSVKVARNQKVYFQQQGSNISSLSVIMGAAGTGSVSRRSLGSDSRTYETYAFNSSTLNRKYYKQGILKNNTNTKYDTRYGSSRYVQFRVPSRASGWMTTKKGTVTFFYPSDYVNIKATKR